MQTCIILQFMKSFHGKNALVQHKLSGLEAEVNIIKLIIFYFLFDKTRYPHEL